jgi:hypothetical protein
MFSVITNIYNKNSEVPTLMELFTSTVKLKKLFVLQLEMFNVYVPKLPRDVADLKLLTIAAAKNIDAPMLTRVWQELEYRTDMCCVNRGAHIEHL